MDSVISIKEAINGIKRPIIVIVIVGVLLNLGLALMGLGARDQVKEISSKWDTLEVCMNAIADGFNGAELEELYSKELLSDLRSTTFEIEDIGLVKQTGPHACDVVVKDSKGFRSYSIKVRKSKSYPLGYQVHEIRGQKLVSEYQIK